jgi:CspA family cold shock protein
LINSCGHLYSSDACSIFSQRSVERTTCANAYPLTGCERFAPPPNVWVGSEFLLKEAPMNTGTVKWFNIQRGYGFIQPEDGSKDVFDHISAVERSDLGNLQEGQKLGYEIEKSEQGKISAVSLQMV